MKLREKFRELWPRNRDFLGDILGIASVAGLAYIFLILGFMIQ